MLPVFWLLSLLNASMASAVGSGRKTYRRTTKDETHGVPHGVYNMHRLQHCSSPQTLQASVGHPSQVTRSILRGDGCLLKNMYMILLCVESDRSETLCCSGARSAFWFLSDQMYPDQRNLLFKNALHRGSQVAARDAPALLIRMCSGSSRARNWSTNLRMLEN